MENMKEIAKFTNIEDGVEATVYNVPGHYRVIFRDIDAEMNIEVRNYPIVKFELAQAISYAQSLV